MLPIRRFLTPVIVALVAFGCASSHNDSTSGYGDKAPAQLVEPDIKMWQVGSTPFVARHETGASSVRLAIRVLNNSSEPLTLDRVQVQSMGIGAYTIPSSTQPIGKSIAPNKFEQFEFWIPVQVEDTITGANGPVSLRGIAYFTSSTGRFRQVFLDTLNDQMSGSQNPG